MNASPPGSPPSILAASTTALVSVALERQAVRLEALVRRVDAARSSLPGPDAGVWKGPAHSLYTLALQALVTEVDAAHGSLSSALRDSRRAHAALAADA
jgi:hypothetical protein